MTREVERPASHVGAPRWSTSARSVATSRRESPGSPRGWDARSSRPAPSSCSSRWAADGPADDGRQHGGAAAPPGGGSARRAARSRRRARPRRVRGRRRVALITRPSHARSSLEDRADAHRASHRASRRSRRVGPGALDARVGLHAGSRLRRRLLAMVRALARDHAHRGRARRHHLPRISEVGRRARMGRACGSSARSRRGRASKSAAWARSAGSRQASNPCASDASTEGLPSSSRSCACVALLISAVASLDLSSALSTRGSSRPGQAPRVGRLRPRALRRARRPARHRRPGNAVERRRARR